MFLARLPNTWTPPQDTADLLEFQNRRQQGARSDNHTSAAPRRLASNSNLGTRIAPKGRGNLTTEVSTATPCHVRRSRHLSPQESPLKLTTEPCLFIPKISCRQIHPQNMQLPARRARIWDPPPCTDTLLLRR